MLIPVIAIVGPTASGKSKLAVELAQVIKGEIISADSRQVYRGLDIGTGKITKREMLGIPHHMLNVASPAEQFSVAQYVPMAEDAIRDVVVRSHVPIVCGGTGQYLDALLRGSQVPEVPPQQELRAKLEPMSAEELFVMLKQLDPVRAESIDPNNRRRLIRAIEIVKFTGKPVPTIAPATKAPFDVLWLGVEADPQELRGRIRQRLDERINLGLVREVTLLHERGMSWDRMEELGLEYRYTARHLQGKLIREDYVKQLTDAICQYARRQRTWWRRHPDIVWVNNLAEAVRLSKQFLAKPH